MIFTSETAKTGDPHVEVGFVARDGGAVISPRLIKYARAEESLMKGGVVRSLEAARTGLGNFAVSADALIDQVDRFANRLAAGAVKAIRRRKMSVNIRLRQLTKAIIDVSLAYEALSNITPDHQEAVNAVCEKRAPKFGTR